MARMKRSALRRQDAVANMREALARRAGRGTGLSSGTGFALGRSKNARNLARARSWFPSTSSGQALAHHERKGWEPFMVRRAHHERNFLAQSWLTGTMESHHERKLPARACPDAAMATQAGFHWPARETLNKHGTHSSRASSLPQDQAMVGASLLATILDQTFPSSSRLRPCAYARR